VVLQDLKIVKNVIEQADRIRFLHNENDGLVKNILDLDQQIMQKEFSIKMLVLQMASNLQELYTFGEFQYPISCIYSVITRNLELKGVSIGTRHRVWEIFSQPDNRKYMYSTNELALISDSKENQIVETELKQFSEQVKQAFDVIEQASNIVKNDAKTRQILQDVTIKVGELAPKLVDKCDKAGICLPQRTQKEEPVRIRKEDPADNDLTGWLTLLIEELTKVRDKFLVYRTKDPAEMRHFCAGVKVHVQLLRSLSNDKWARNIWYWLGVIKQKVDQSNHSAQSMSGIFGRITGKRNLTREQIKAKTPMVLQFAQEFIENSPGYWDMCYASTKLRETNIGDFHNDRHEKLSDSSIG